MSDADLHYSSDEYHEDSYHDLHRDDSLPDLVLSSSTVLHCFLPVKGD